MTTTNYHFDLDEIEHDPYVLISILSAFNEGEFTLDEVQGFFKRSLTGSIYLTEDVEGRGALPHGDADRQRGQ